MAPRRLNSLGFLLIFFACSEQSSSSPTGDVRPTSFSGWPSRVDLSGVSLDQYCETAARIDCGRLQQCASNTLKSRFGTRSGCEEVQTQRCHSDFIESAVTVLIRQGLVDYSPNRMGLALEVHSAQHCDTQKLSPTPFSALEPRQQNGEPCSRHAFCLSGFCTENSGRACGQCATKPTNAPQECPEQCPIKERCECQDDNCACVANLGIYSDCTDQPTACEDGSTCLRGKTIDGTPKTVCVPFPKIGEPCGARTGLVDCVGDAICREGICTPPEIVFVSEECNQTDKRCAFGLDCRGVCVPQAGQEESCIIITQQTNTSSTTAPTCASGACRNTCQAPLKRGDVCVDSVECEESLGCLFGSNGRAECKNSTDAERYFRELFVCP